MGATTIAERLDRAVDQLLAGAHPGGAAALAGTDPGDRQVVITAARLRAALQPPRVAPRFEARLGARLAGAAASRPAVGDAVGWALRHRLPLVTGAVGSAVGVGVTAYAVWRSTRRPVARAGRAR